MKHTEGLKKVLDSHPIAGRMYGKVVPGPHIPVRVGVGVVIRNLHGWILLEKRRDCGLWGLPGGRIEPGESVKGAAVREIKEETGLGVEVLRLIGVYSDPEGRIITYPDNGDVVQIIDIVVEARIIAGTLTCSHESEEVRFFDPKALPMEIIPPVWAPIQDVLKGCEGQIR